MLTSRISLLMLHRDRKILRNLISNDNVQRQAEIAYPKIRLEIIPQIS